MKIKIIALPGNGGAPEYEDNNWFSGIKNELESDEIKVLAPNFPDPFIGRQKYWLPFLKEIGADENTILIGYSTGAIAAMRYAEKNKVLGMVLIAGYHTDLGMKMEKDAGYFDEPWDWEAIKKNTSFIIQFHSENDRTVPIKEALFVHENLNSEFYDLKTLGHFHNSFYDNDFPELISSVKAKIDLLSKAK